MLGELGNVVKDELVGVSKLVQLLLVGVGHDTTDDLGDGVIELGVTTEFLPLLCVLMLISHFSNIVVTALNKTAERFLNLFKIYYLNRYVLFIKFFLFRL